MIDDERDLPQFLRETRAEDPALDLRAVEQLPLLLEPESTIAPGLDRLIAAVSDLPLRYAPFFERLSVLWDLPEAEVVEVLDSAKSLKVWRKAPLFKIRTFGVTGGPRTQGGETFLVRFEPGVTLPSHRHPGPEALLVLEGRYKDSLGRSVGPGDLHEMAAGTEHSLSIGKDEPCVGAALQYGRQFTGPIMGLLAKIIDR